MHDPIPRLGESLDLMCVPIDDSASATLDPSEISSHGLSCGTAYLWAFGTFPRD